MYGKKLYSKELKLEIVQRYLEGKESMATLANVYHIDKGDIQKWRDAYLENGVIGLCTIHRTYSGDFKVNVVEYMHTTGASLRKTAAHFNIPSRECISKWERIYYEEGKGALYEERRGRTSKVGSKMPKKSKTSVETNEVLLAEVQQLRMENEYLKKLNALIQEREKSVKKIK
jgi:transposase